MSARWRSMVEVLVTGGAGFIGSNFVRWAHQRAPGLAHHDARQADVRRPDRKPARRHGQPAPPVRARATSRTRPSRRRSCAPRNIVVHFAAETHVDRSIHGGRRVHPHRRLRHVRAARSRARGARRSAGSSRFRPTRSTAACPTGHSRETDELRPRNPYSASKAGADRLAYSYWATYGVPVVITRASNNYGPNQFPEKVIPLFITNAIDSKPLPLYGDGLNVRDWLHVDDHCRGIDLLIERGQNGEVYNIGGGNEVRNVDLTHRILSLVGTARRRSSRRSPIARATIGATRSTPASCARLGWSAVGRVRVGPRRHRRVVPRERVVVAADQGTGRGLPRVPRRAVRHRARRPDAHAARNDSGHRRDGIRRRAPARPARRSRAADRLVPARAASRPIPTATSTGAPSTCWTPPKWRAASRKRRRRRSFTSPARRWSPRRSRRVVPHLQTNVLGTHHLLEAVRRSGRAVPRARRVVGAGLPDQRRAARRERAAACPATPYGLSKLGAGPARGRARGATTAWMW